MNKLKIGEVIAVGGLNEAIQLCEVFLIQGDSRHFAKAGFEIKLVGKGQNEKELKPKSFYVNEKELPKLDKLIRYLITLRWKLHKIKGDYDPEFIQDLIDFHKEKYRNSINEGLA